MTKKSKERFEHLDDKLIVIKNKDKDSGWGETWKSGQSPALIPHSFRLLSLGGCGRGKTNVLKQLFLKHQSTRRPFKHLYIITCDLTSKEWDDCEPDEIYDEIPELDVFDTGEKSLIVLDDYEQAGRDKTQKKRLTTMFRFISTHKNISLMCSYQSFFDCSQLLRKVCNVFIIYRPNSKQELVTIANRVSIDYEFLRKTFKEKCPDYYDFLVVDLTKNTPYRIRKNVYEVLDYDSDDEY